MGASSLTFASWNLSNTLNELLTIALPFLRLPPCLALFLSFHIPQHIVIAFSTKPRCDSDHLCNYHITSINIHVGLILNGMTSLLEDHVSLALSQSQNKWQVDLAALPQESQVQSLVIFLFFKFSLAAKMFVQAFQAKCLILFGTFIAQRCLHICFKAAWSELSGVFPSECTS